MVQDDEDIVKGLGYVCMYAAWVEEDVDDLLRIMERIEPFDRRTQRWGISRKLNHAASLVRRLDNPELKGLPEALGVGIDLFEKRNEVLHGRIYASIADRTDYIKSGRRNAPTRPITSAEVYQLANDFFNYRRNLIGPQPFRLPNAIDKALKDGTIRRGLIMPEISRFFGIIIRMFFDEHNPPHIHVEHQGNKAVFDLSGNITRGNLKSRTAIKLVREWIDLHVAELVEDWDLAQAGKEIKKIDPLD